MVVADEPPHGRREAEPAEERVAPDRVLLDERVFLVVQRSGLLQHLVRDGQLADVVEKAAGGELAQPRRREPELLPNLHCQVSDASGVAFGVRVLLRQEADEPTDLRAEEGLLGGDELGAAKVPASGREGEERKRSAATGAPTRRTPATSSPWPSHHARSM